MLYVSRDEDPVRSRADLDGRGAEDFLDTSCDANKHGPAETRDSRKENRISGSPGTFIIAATESDGFGILSGSLSILLLSGIHLEPLQKFPAK
jgi:hypothetical protein